MPPPKSIVAMIVFASCGRSSSVQASLTSGLMSGATKVLALAVAGPKRVARKVRMSETA
jgi:hypothetical protein